jgi:ABC-type lipoprotein release transport system permease subunit
MLALAAARAIASLLFGLRPYDVRSLTLAIVLLTAVTLAASYLPARRASRLEPMAALHEE